VPPQFVEKPSQRASGNNAHIGTISCSQYGYNPLFAAGRVAHISLLWETVNLNSPPFLPEGEKENSPGWSAAQSGECPPNNVVRPVGVL
jgi:hypothetical protein